MSHENDMLFLRRNAHRFSGTVLEVGSKRYKGHVMDVRSLFPNVLGVDQEPGAGVDVVHDFLQPFDAQFDGIVCCNVLEHSPKPWVVARNLMECLRPGGVLVASTPWIWRRHNYPGDFCRFSVEGLKAVFDGLSWVDEGYATTAVGEFLSDEEWRKGFGIRSKGVDRNAVISELAYVCGVK